MATDPEPGRPPLRPGLAVRRTDLADAPIVYDDPPRRAVPQLQARDMEVMRALWRYTFLSTSQIGDTWWPERHPSRPQIRLSELAGAGLLLRFRPLVKRGTHQWIYQLARGGFRAAQKSYGPEGTYIDESARFAERRAADMASVEHALRVNGWMLAYRLFLGDRMLDWRGSREARVLSPDDAREDGVAPDAAALIDLGPTAPPLELLIELRRDERPVRLAERLRRYDELLSEGWRSIPRFQRSTEPPAAMFIAQGYHHVDQLLQAADGLVSAARARVIFCAEPDIHRGDLRAWMLPEQTAEQRGSAAFTATEIALPV
jgi:Replication-relaxation